MKNWKFRLSLICALVLLTNVALGTTPQTSLNLRLGTITYTAGQLVIADGTKLASQTVSGDVTISSAGVTAIGASKVTSAMLAGSIDATKIADGSVTSTEFQYINTLSSNAQTQIDAKQATLSGASLTGVTVATDDKVLIQDTSDSNNLKTVTTQAIADLASGSGTGSTVATNVYTYTTNGPTGSTAIPNDDTIPQIAEGEQIFSQAYSMASTTNQLLIEINGHCTTNGGIYTVALFYDGASNAIAARQAQSDSTSVGGNFMLTHLFTPGSTSSKTVSVRIGNNAGNNVRCNGTTSARTLGGVQAVTMKFTEIKG